MKQFFCVPLGRKGRAQIDKKKPQAARRAVCMDGVELGTLALKPGSKTFTSADLVLNFYLSKVRHCSPRLSESRHRSGSVVSSLKYQGYSPLYVSHVLYLLISTMYIR